MIAMMHGNLGLPERTESPLLLLFTDQKRSEKVDRKATETDLEPHRHRRRGRHAQESWRPTGTA